MTKLSSLHMYFLAGLISLTAISAQAGQPGNVIPTQLDQQMILVEDLSAEFHSESGTLVVTAKIKNNSQSMLRGYVTVYLLSAEGKKVHAFQEEVNEGEAFPHGAMIDLKATSRMSDIEKVASISVDFTPN